MTLRLHLRRWWKRFELRYGWQVFYACRCCGQVMMVPVELQAEFRKDPRCLRCLHSQGYKDRV